MSDKEKDEKEDKPKRYFWFQGASVLRLYYLLEQIGPDKARVEFEVRGDDAYIRVKGGDYHGPEINDSHVCPPFC